MPGLMISDAVVGSSKSAFAAYYPFWEMVGATMWDVVIGCFVLVAFLLVLGLTCFALWVAGNVVIEAVQVAIGRWEEWRWSR